MGVGKTALGKRLAQSLDVSFSDTDDILVARHGQSINDIFLQHGEPYFRVLESKLLAEIDYTKSQLIATGGGLPIAGSNMEFMKGNGVVVFLKDELDSIAARLYKGKHKRPAIKDLDMQQIKDKLKIMLDTRTSIYDRAHLTFLRSKDLDADVIQLSTYLKMYL